MRGRERSWGNFLLGSVVGILFCGAVLSAAVGLGLALRGLLGLS